MSRPSSSAPASRSGPGLKGAALTTVVVAHAADDYRVAFSLGELDAALARQDIIVADTTDSAPLVGPQGPLRLVVPKDSRGARSVRMLVRLEVRSSSATIAEQASAPQKRT